MPPSATHHLRCVDTPKSFSSELVQLAGSSTAIANVDQWLADACEGHAFAEIHFESPDGPVITRRVRLNRATATHLHAEASRLDRKRPEIPPGRPVTVHVSLRGARFQFRSVVEPPSGVARRRGPNSAQDILLRRPKALEESQRRAALRISVTGMDPIDVDVVPVHPDYPDACAVDASRVRTAMINLSASGVGVLSESDALDTSEDAPPYFLSFRLPDGEERLDMMAELRSARRVEASESWRVGFAFRAWSGRSFAADQRAITQFITEQERRLLRRRR